MEDELKVIYFIVSVTNDPISCRVLTIFLILTFSLHFFYRHLSIFLFLFLYRYLSTIFPSLLQHELKEIDNPYRITFCKCLLQFTKNNLSKLDTFFYSDESWLHLDGYVYSQNFRLWSSENPHEFPTISLHPLKIEVRCTMSCVCIVGLIFFPWPLLVKFTGV